jgi:hypothetical protein
VISRLVLHYIDNIDVQYANIYRALLDGGQFIFSAEHPVITSSERLASWDAAPRLGGG